MEQINQKELETLRLWLERYQTSENYCRPFFEKGQKNYLLYKSYKKTADKAYHHDIFVPYSFAYAEDCAAYFMLSVLAAPQVYSIGRRFSGPSLEVCLAAEAAVNWVISEEGTEFALELEELIKNVTIFNVAYLVNYPVINERKEGDRVVNFLERLQLDSPSPLDVFPEPATKRLSRAGWIIKRSREDWRLLKEWEKKGIYKNVDVVKDSGFGAEDDPVAKMLSDIGIGTAGPWTYDAKSNRVEILDCMKDGDVITIGGRKAIIRDTTGDTVRPFSFPFPILDCRFEGAPGEFFGVGKIESIKPTQEELNVLRSQRRDNISLVLNKLWVIDLMAGEVDMDTLFSAPGNAIITTNREAIEELPVSDVTGSSYKEEESLIYDFQNITSMWDYSRGGTPRRKETATGIVRLQQAAQSRNEWQLKKLDLYILTPLAKRVLVYVRENMPRQDFADIIGRRGDPATENIVAEFYDMSPQQIRKGFKFMPMTESIVSLKELDMNQFLQAFDRLIQLPDVNRISLVKQLLLKLGQKDIKEILPMLSGPAQDATVEAMAQAPAGQPAAPPMPNTGGGMMPPGGGA